MRLAGTVVYNADEPDSWPYSDYSWVFKGFLTSMRTAGIVFRHGRTCSKRTRVVAFCIIASEAARGHDIFCCVRLKRVAGAHFANVIEQKFPSQVIEKQ